MLLGLSLLFLTGILFSECFKLVKLPHFLGLILAGVLVRSFLPQDFYDVAPDLKKMALVVLMTRVSLNLKVNEIKEMGIKAALVSFIPPTVELIGAAIFFNVVCGINMTSALVMGAVTAAASPAISVPILLKAKHEGYGVKKRIPQMLIASGGIDNAYILVVFHILLKFDQNGGFQLVGLLDIPIAFITGGIAGFIIYNIEMFFIKIFKLKDTMRIIVTLSSSFFLLSLEDSLGQYVSYSGIIAILTVGIIMLYKEEALEHELSMAFKNIWSFIEILLFGIVGAAINFGILGDYLILGIVLSILCMALRIIGMLLALVNSGFNIKEKLFCGISLTSKATVQASLGAIPLSLGLPYGDQILALSVIAIFITSPVCAILTENTYSKLLTCNSSNID